MEAHACRSTESEEGNQHKAPNLAGCLQLQLYNYVKHMDKFRYMGITRIQYFSFLFHSYEKEAPCMQKNEKYLSKLLIRPHSQKYMEREKDEHQRGWSRTCSSVFLLRQPKDDTTNILTSSTTRLMFHIIISEIVGAHLSTFRREGACWRSSVRRYHHWSSGAMRIRVLSQPHLRAAAVRLWLHLPAGDQVGLQAWGDRNRERGVLSLADQMKLKQVWVGFRHRCVDEGIGGLLLGFSRGPAPCRMSSLCELH